MIPEQIQRRYYTKKETANILELTEYELNARIALHDVSTGINATPRIRAIDLKILKNRTKRATKSGVLKLCRANLRKEKAKNKQLEFQIYNLTKMNYGNTN